MKQLGKNPRTKADLQKLVAIANKGYKAIEELWTDYPDQIECYRSDQDWEPLSNFCPVVQRKLRLKRKQKDV